MQKKTTIKLCTSCFNCKSKGGKVYRKFYTIDEDGKKQRVWEENDDGRTILHTPFDFNCPEYEEA